MSGTKHTFCRRLLATVMEDVREAIPSSEIEKAWGYKCSWPNSVEFHGPDGFYWHGQGCCVWHAKAQGWQAYLDHIGWEPSEQREIDFE